jgi:hypothetical protein
VKIQRRSAIRTHVPADVGADRNAVGVLLQEVVGRFADSAIANNDRVDSGFL